MPGPSSFSRPMLSLGVWLEGSFFHEGARYYPGRTSAVRVGQGARLTTAARTHVVQHHWTGGDAPVNLDPLQQQLQFLLTRESDYQRFEEAKSRGDLRRLWFDYWVTDQWFLPGGADGATTWRTSRRLPYSGLIPGVTIGGDRAPVAHLEDASRVQTVQTVVQTSPPSAGEVTILDVDDYADVETPAGLSESWLLVSYPAVFLVRIVELEVVWQDANVLRVAVDVEESLGGTYTPAS